MVVPRLPTMDLSSAAGAGAGVPESPVPLDGVIDLMPQVGLVAVATGLVGLVLLLPPVRRLVARVLPIDPARVVHAVALQYAAYLVAVSALTAILLTLIVGNEAALEQLADDAASAGGLSTLWAQSLGFVLLGLLGVGLGVQRDGRATLERLGLTTSFSVRWWLGATALGLLCVYVIDNLWALLGSESLEQVERLSEALFAPYLEAGLLGALTIGLSAGIGEEILFRGAAQPKMGLVFTSLMFATLHTQYTVSPALLQVLLVGLLLGLTRRQVNTTTSIAVHATYNFVLAAVAIYG